MTELVITRGYPASGKSTWAIKHAEQPGWVRVCRDDLRWMLFHRQGTLDHEQEQRVTTAEHTQVEALLRAGASVVVDATHLRLRFARAWADLALKLGVEFRVEDFDTPADECVRRDKERGAAGLRMVGEDAIRAIAVKFPIGRREPVTARVREEGATPQRYIADPSLPSAWLIDIDGTLARMDGRSPFEWERVGEDKPVASVVEVVQRLAPDHQVIVMSGRDESCREVTQQWLSDNEIPFDQLLMRPARDIRKDSVIKAELFDGHVRGLYQVGGVIDDRLQVCRMWHAMGLPLFRVGDPDASF